MPFLLQVHNDRALQRVQGGVPKGLDRSHDRLLLDVRAADAGTNAVPAMG